MQLVRFRVDLAPHCSLGPGKIALLEAIAKKGSLTQAAASLGMSYRYGWLLLNDLRLSFTQPLTSARKGGAKGGGVSLTEFGREVIRRYHLAHRRIERIAKTTLAPLSARVARKAPARGAPRHRARSIKKGGFRTGAGIPR